jgi:hypothetical protein
VLVFEMQYSITPVLQPLLRCSERVEGNEADASFSAVYSFPDLAIPIYDKLCRGQLFESHRTESMDLACTDADLRA